MYMNIYNKMREIIYKDPHQVITIEVSSSFDMRDVRRNVLPRNSNIKVILFLIQRFFRLQNPPK